MRWRTVYVEMRGSGTFFPLAAAAQVVIVQRKHRVDVRRRVHANGCGLFVGHMVDEAGLMMTEAVMAMTLSWTKAGLLFWIMNHSGFAAVGANPSLFASARRMTCVAPFVRVSRPSRTGVAMPWS